MSDPGRPTKTFRADDWDAPVCGMTWGHSGVRGTWTPGRRTVDGGPFRPQRQLGDAGHAAVQETAQSSTVPFREAPSLTDDEVGPQCDAPRARG